MSAFYLVQRLRRRDSAEFEWGALPESLKRIRTAGRKLTVHEGEVTRVGVTVPVFVVGHRRDVETIPARLTEWMADAYPRGKEMTYFPEKVTGTASEYQRTDAWWALGEDVMWTLDEDVAAALLRAIAS